MSSSLSRMIACMRDVTADKWNVRTSVLVAQFPGSSGQA